MDTDCFKSSAPGSLVEYKEDQYAFVPFPLPPDWEFPLHLWPLLAEMKQQMGLLEGIGRNLPNPGILLRPLEDREAIRSLRLEGTYVTAEEFLLFEIEPKESVSENDPANERREVFNYRKALHQGTGSDLPLSLRLLRELHKTLLSDVRGKDRTPGEFRRGQVAIGTDHRFVPPPPDRLMECLDPLEKYFHVTDSPYDPIINSFLVHYQFETIHPFNDGNGRIGRVLLALMLQQSCKLSKSWLYMSEYFDDHREEYIQRLFDISTSADWSRWIEFCLQGTLSQAKKTIERCDLLRSLREDYIRKVSESGGPARLAKIVEAIFYSPMLRITDLSEKLGVSYPTAKADVERLVRVKILRELPNVSPKTFFAPEVFAIAYSGLE